MRLPKKTRQQRRKRCQKWILLSWRVRHQISIKLRTRNQMTNRQKPTLIGQKLPLALLKYALMRVKDLIAHVVGLNLHLRSHRW